MSLLNISNYEEELNQHSYRRTVELVVDQFDHKELISFLSNLNEDQLDEKLPSTFDMSTDDLRKLTCLVVWNWGWEGSDCFIKMFM